MQFSPASALPLPQVAADVVCAVQGVGDLKVTMTAAIIAKRPRGRSRDDQRR